MSQELAEVTYDKLYRFENPRGYENTVTKLTFRVVKRTPCGARIKRWEWENTTKFVNLTCKKKWAHETEAEALTSFMRRKRCEMEYNRQRMNNAEAAIKYAEIHFGKNQTADDPVQRVWKRITPDICY